MAELFVALFPQYVLLSHFMLAAHKTPKPLRNHFKSHGVDIKNVGINNELVENTSFVVTLVLSFREG